MKNSIITAVLVLCTITATYAQKIKVKKGFVEADKVQIAKVDVQGSTYVFSSIANEEEKVIVDFKILKISDQVTKKWLIVKNGDESKSSEIEMDFLSFSLSTKKAIAELLLKKYNIISVDKGVDVEELNKFLAIERPSLTKENNNLLRGEVAATRELANALNSIEVSVWRNKQIYEGILSEKSPFDYEDKRIGYYTQTQEGQMTRFNLLDLDVHKVAIATVGRSGTSVEVVLPYANKKFTYDFKRNQRNNDGSFNSSSFVKDLVKQVIVNGTKLRHQVMEQKENALAAYKEQRKEAYEDAKEASNNIYDAPGYLITDKGERLEGDLSVKWTDIPAPGNWNNVVAIGGKDTGKKVSVRYKNKKGKTRYKTFSSKDGERFCVTLNGEENCYIGAKLKGKGLELAAGAVGSLNFDTSEYYKIIEEGEDYLILQDVDNGKYSVQIKGEKKGFQFNTRNEEKNVEGMNKYFGGDYSSLSKLDYTQLSSVQEVISVFEQQK